MNSASDADITEEQFLAAVSAIRFIMPDLSPIGAAILVAIDFGVARDSRSFSNKLGIEHALVIREITALSSTELGLLTISRRNERTQRTEFAQTAKAQELVLRASASSGLPRAQHGRSA
jgi:hypothetical protein